MLAYSLRFIHNVREKDPSKKLHGALSFKEIDCVMLAVVKLEHKDIFYKEIDLLSRGEFLDKNARMH